MLKYVERNVNPKNKKTGDCAIRAISIATGLSWDEALTELYCMSLKTKYGILSTENIEKVLECAGFVRMKQPRKLDNTKYEVREMDQVLDENVVAVLHVAHHCVPVIGREYIDIWNSGRKTVGKYYIKKGE